MEIHKKEILIRALKNKNLLVPREGENHHCLNLVESGHMQVTRYSRDGIGLPVYRVTPLGAKAFVGIGDAVPAVSWYPIKYTGTKEAPFDGKSVLVFGGKACPDIGDSWTPTEPVKVRYDDGEWDVVDVDYSGIRIVVPTH